MKDDDKLFALVGKIVVYAVIGTLAFFVIIGSILSFLAMFFDWAYRLFFHFDETPIEFVATFAILAFVASLVVMAIRSTRR